MKSVKKLTAALISLIAFCLLLVWVIVPVKFLSTVTRPENGWKDRFAETTDPGTRAPFMDYVRESKVWFESLETYEAETESPDGIIIRADVLPCPDAKGTFIMMHGFHSNNLFEFAGIMQYVYSLGYNLVLPHQRSHGTSGGKYITFGVKEHYDCLEWVKYANRTFGEDTPLYLMGVSMGAATVLMTLGFDLPDNVAGCIADCGYTAPGEIVSVRLKQIYHLIPFIFYPGVNLWNKIVCGISLDEYSPVEALKSNTKVPVLFVHGKKDDYVPYYMSERNYNECKSEKYFLSTEAEHAASFLTAPEEYKKAILDFTN